MRGVRGPDGLIVRPRQGGKFTERLDRLADLIAGADCRQAVATADPAVHRLLTDRFGSTADVHCSPAVPRGSVLMFPADTAPITWTRTDGTLKAHKYETG